MKRTFVALTSLAVAGFVSACASKGPLPETDYANRHPIAVSPVQETIKLTVPADSIGLSSDDQRIVRAVALAYKDIGHGPILLSVPSGGPNAQAAIQSASEVRNILHDFNVDWASIEGTAYPSRGMKDAPLVLSFTRFEATGPDCAQVQAGNWAYNPKNLTSGTFGCFMQANLAAMVADPADLLGNEIMGAPITERRLSVLEKYIAGEPTATQRSDDESAQVSDAVN